MAELIDKKSALNALSSASYGNFNYVTARNAIDCVSTTTEAEIRAKAIDEFAEKAEKQLIDFDTENGFISFGVCLDIISKVADQLKEE